MRTYPKVFILFVLVFSASSLFAQSITAPSGEGCVNPAFPALPNANQLALLRWYGANTVSTFPTGGAPNGIAFDGPIYGWWVDPLILFQSSEPMTLRCSGHFQLE